MMHNKEIQALQILRVHLRNIHCKNALAMLQLRLKYRELREENDKIDSLVTAINDGIDKYFEDK